MDREFTVLQLHSLHSKTASPPVVGGGNTCWKRPSTALDTTDCSGSVSQIEQGEGHLHLERRGGGVDHPGSDLWEAAEEHYGEVAPGTPGYSSPWDSGPGVEGRLLLSTVTVL